MNRELKDRIFKVPDEIIKHISDVLGNLKGEDVYGIDRASNLLLKKEVSYGQLKSIIHDFKTIDKERESTKYELMGGILMDRWAKVFLDGERDFIKKRKDSKMRADEIGGIDGERGNAHIKKHKKNGDLNLVGNTSIKSNSDKNMVSALVPSMKLFEEINKIKKLML